MSDLPEAPRGDPKPRVRSVALLLAVAAVLAAAIAARASLLASDASGQWESAVRTELKLSAAMSEDVRFTYDDEGPNAFRLAMAAVRTEEFRARARGAPAAVRARLLLEAAAQEFVRSSIQPSVDLAQDDRYALPGGGYDLGKRLADNRAEHPDLVTLNPGALQAAGDHRADRAVFVLMGTIPVGIAFLFGALAQAYHRRRSRLVVWGWVFAVASVLVWVAAEVLQ